jgi:hypothetical protein
MELSKDALLLAWKTAKEQLTTATATERELRAKVIEAFSTINDEMHSGVENVDLGFDRWVLKIDHKLNYKLNGDNQLIALVLTQIATSREGGNLLAERLVKWKPEISVSEYKLLDGGQRVMIDKILTITPATKALELTQKSK